jgi:hypothetical protein
MLSRHPVEEAADDTSKDERGTALVSRCHARDTGRGDPRRRRRALRGGAGRLVDATTAGVAAHVAIALPEARVVDRRGVLRPCCIGRAVAVRSSLDGDGDGVAERSSRTAMCCSIRRCSRSTSSSSGDTSIPTRRSSACGRARTSSSSLSCSAVCSRRCVCCSTNTMTSVIPEHSVAKTSCTSWLKSMTTTTTHAAMTAAATAIAMTGRVVSWLRRWTAQLVVGRFCSR